MAFVSRIVLAALSWCAAASVIAADGAASAPAVGVAGQPAREAPACQVDRPDALVGERVHIRPGETLCIRMVARDGRLVPEALVAAPDAADAVIATAARTDDVQTMLTIANPFSQLLRYKAWLRRPGDAQDRYGYTSSCPVIANHGKAFELWPYPVAELVLADFSLEPALEADGKTERPLTCR